MRHLGASRNWNRLERARGGIGCKKEMWVIPNKVDLGDKTGKLRARTEDEEGSLTLKVYCLGHTGRVEKCGRRSRGEDGNHGERKIVPKRGSGGGQAACVKRPRCQPESQEEVATRERWPEWSFSCIRIQARAGFRR